MELRIERQRNLNPEPSALFLPVQTEIFSPVNTTHLFSSYMYLYHKFKNNTPFKNAFKFRSTFSIFHLPRIPHVKVLQHLISAESGGGRQLLPGFLSRSSRKKAFWHCRRESCLATLSGYRCARTLDAQNKHSQRSTLMCRSAHCPRFCQHLHTFFTIRTNIVNS